MSKPFPFDTAPRSLRRPVEPRLERIIRASRAGDHELVGAVFAAMGCEAGMQGYASTPVHRLGCDMAKTAESLLRALSFNTRLEALRAKQHAEDEALRREAWAANAPVREVAAQIAALGGRPSRLAIQPENVELALAAGLEVEIIPEPQP